MINLSPVHIAAQTAWGEARNQGERGMQAVLNVIGTRAKFPGWWGTGIVGVCHAREQFSCWNPAGAHSDHAAMLAVTGDDPQFQIAVRLATQLVADALPDLTDGADSYYADTIAPPPWSRAPARYTVTIGAHRFFVTRHGGEGGLVHAVAPAAVVVRAAVTADSLNAGEISSLQQGAQA